MRTKFDEQLRTLNTEMVHMGNMIEEAIQNALDDFSIRTSRKQSRL